MTAALYADDEKEVQETLEKMSLKELYPKNRSLYAYVNLCMNQKKELPAEVEKWSQVLKETPGSEKFFVKAKIFSKEEG